jgi:hypothetical protein
LGVAEDEKTGGAAWSDGVDAVLGGDLTAALAYLTPAGGAVVTAVAPVGLRDRDAGTVTFTTSLGFGRKIGRIEKNPRIALAYHAREHGFAGGSQYVLVQGTASVVREPDRRYLEEVVQPQAERFMGPPKRGRLFWDRWLKAYYSDRVPVNVEVVRVACWPDADCLEEPSIFGPPLPPAPPPQAPPARGAGPRVDSHAAARRLSRLKHLLLAFAGGDGYPLVVPVSIDGVSAEGLHIAGPPPLLPPGGRRAGLLGHEYRPQLIGLAARQHTGWLDVEDEEGRAAYAPHTERGFRAPANKTLFLLANGFLARRGLRAATRRQASGTSPV